MSGRIVWVLLAAGTCFGGEVRDAAELSLPGASNAIALGPCQFLGGANPPEEWLGLQGDDTQLSPPMCPPGLWTIGVSNASLNCPSHPLLLVRGRKAAGKFEGNSQWLDGFSPIYPV